MMMTKQKILFSLSVLFCCMFSESAKAQDPTFSQFYANPLHLNPSFAGADGCPKIHVNFRDQWPSIAGTFISSSVSYDKHLPSINSGWGFQILHDNAGAGFLNSIKAGGFFSHQLKINKKNYVRVGAEVAFQSHFLDIDKVILPDQIDDILGVINQSSADLSNLNSSAGYMDLSLGGMYYSNRYFVGYTANHLNQPINSFLDSYVVGEQTFKPQSRLKLKHTVHAGANFSVSGNKRKGIAVTGPFMTVGMIYQNQGIANQLNLGLSLTNKSISGGVWYRRNNQNSDAVILVVGTTYRNLQIGYSYDITVSKLADVSGGAHELSLRIQLPCKEKVKKVLPLTCPRL
jgi:type IX secretion system PorP/SprF family membrane protein